MSARLLSAVLLTLLTATPALAQVDPAGPPRGGIWPGVVIAFLLVSLIIAANVKRSGRGHQD